MKFFEQVEVWLGDQLKSVNGTPITNSNELKNILAPLSAGQTVSVEILTAHGETKTADIILSTFPATDRIAYFILPTILSLTFLIVSLWIFGLRRTEAAGRAFSIFTSSLAQFWAPPGAHWLAAWARSPWLSVEGYAAQA